MIFNECRKLNLSPHEDCSSIIEVEESAVGLIQEKFRALILVECNMYRVGSFCDETESKLRLAVAISRGDRAW